ncbi:hypothetical protein GGX14DRAFT_571725 [Mycena pura]|uniref:Uncharacterized protein n=1 Tax=Mycena pura TaxID=153505 RepID=A0AAD6Y7S9_9AGAR|nr:hypothetical protein GGX14DRAFT_571725 [Mycena pura]
MSAPTHHTGSAPTRCRSDSWSRCDQTCTDLHRLESRRPAARSTARPTAIPPPSRRHPAARRTAHARLFVAPLPAQPRGPPVPPPSRRPPPANRTARRPPTAPPASRRPPPARRTARHPVQWNPHRLRTDWLHRVYTGLP